MDLGEAYNHVKLEVSYTCWNDVVFGPKGEDGSTLAFIIRFSILVDGSPSGFLPVYEANIKEILLCVILMDAFLKI